MKKFIAFFMAMVMLCSAFSVSCFAMGSGKSTATNITIGTTYESRLTVKETEWYKIVPDETQYYRFHVRNQSVEWRTGIGLVDWFSNIWNSYVDVLVYDARDDVLGKMSVRCGYEGRLALKLEKGKTYYITLASELAEGNYWLSTTKLSDIGGDSWNTAIDTLSNGQIVSAVDTSDEEDWFCFNAEADRAYYTFSLQNVGGNSDIYLKLYKYVAGIATGFPFIEVESIYNVYKNDKKSFDIQLEEGAKYYYCISGSEAGYILDVSMQLDAAGASRSDSYDIDVGSEYISSFDGTDDVDYYSFETSSNPAYYHFDVENLTGNYYNIWVYDSMGNVVVSDSSGRSKVNLDSKLKPDSTYYLALKGTKANYTFSVTEKADIYPNESEGATVISFGQKYTSSFDGTDDKDYVKFTTGSNPAYYHFDVENLTGNYYNIWVYDSMGNVVVSDSGGRSKVSLNSKLEADSTYYLALKGTNANYTFAVTEKADTYADVIEEATPVTVGAAYSSGFEGDNDKDYVSFTTGRKEAYYNIEAKKISGNPMYVYLYDANGNQLDYDYGYDNEINRKLQPDTTYYVMFKGSDFDYTFTITGKEDAYSDVMNEAGSVSAGTTYSSAFEGDNDKDYVSFTTGSADAYYNIEAKNTSGKSMYVYLLDANGNQIDYDNGTNNEINKKLEPDTTYYVLFEGSNSDYTFKLTEKVDTYADDIERAAEVVLNKEYKSAFEGYGDKDYVKFATGSENAFYSIEAKNTTGKSFYVYLLDDFGDELDYDSGADNSLSGKLEPDTTYYILFKGDTSNYKFKITKSVDIEADESDGAVTVRLNSMKNGALQASGDVDWFMVNVPSAGNYRLKGIPGSSSVKFELYDINQRYKCGFTVYDEYDSVVYLEAGTCFVKVSYGTGNYSFMLANCGDAHKKAYTYPSKASMSKDGQARATCSVCGTYIETVKVPKIYSVALSSTSYTYNGKTKAPSITVKDNYGNTLKKNTDYTVSYESGRKSPGKYTVTITFKGKYEGSKKLYFTILPKATSKVTATQTTTTITLSWSKVTGADGYRVYKYNSKNGNYEKYKDVKGTSLKISKLKAGTKYKYKVRAYTKDGDTLWGAYSKAFETATKTKTPTLKVNSTKKGVATLSWTNVSGESGYQVYYSTKKSSGYKKLDSYKTNVVKGSKKKLTSKKNYYFKVRAYTKTGSGTVYSAWSSVKSVKIK